MLRRFWNWVMGEDFVASQINVAAGAAENLRLYAETATERANETLQHHAVVVKHHADHIAALEEEHRAVCRELLHEVGTWHDERERADRASRYIRSALDAHAPLPAE